MTLMKVRMPDGSFQDIPAIVGPKGEIGPVGPAGADGYTPIKGTDYWTESDKAEIVQEAASSIPIATTEVAGKVKPDGTTVTITEDGTISAVGGGSGGGGTAADISFDNAGTGLAATNVQAALVEINEDLVGSEEVQDMIDENRTWTSAPGFVYTNISTTNYRGSIIKASEIENITTVIEMDSGIFDSNVGVQLLEWDIDDWTSSMRGIVVDTATGRYRVCPHGPSYKTGVALKLRKGHIYRIYTISTQYGHDLYTWFDALCVGKENPGWSNTAPLEVPTQQGYPACITNVSGILAPDAIFNSSTYFRLFWDITPVNQAQVNELATKINSLVDGNEVSY